MPPTRDRERAAADILLALRQDPKALEADDTGQGPGQTAGTGDQKLVGELTEALSRVLCPPHPQGHQLAPWGGPEPNHRSSENTYCFYIFFTRNETLGH